MTSFVKRNSFGNSYFLKCVCVSHACEFHTMHSSFACGDAHNTPQTVKCTDGREHEATRFRSRRVQTGLERALLLVDHLIYLQFFLR